MRFIDTVKFARRKKFDVFGRSVRRGYSGRKLLKLLFWRKRRRRYKAAIFIFNRYDFGGRKFKRKRLTRYGRLLLEKQKLRAFYNFLTQKQLKKYMAKASGLYPANMSGRSLVLDIFFSFLESRLDVAVYRLQFATSLQASRQLVSHKKVQVNGKIVSRGGYHLEPGDIVDLIPSCKFILAKNLFLRFVASDSGLRRKRVHVLLRNVLRKNFHKYNLMYKGFSLKYYWIFDDQSWGGGFVDAGRDLISGHRRGLRFMQKLTYDSCVFVKGVDDDVDVTTGFYVNSWQRSFYVGLPTFHFLHKLALSGVLREGFSNMLVRTICSGFVFRSNWFVSKRFKRRGRFRRQIRLARKHFYSLFLDGFGMANYRSKSFSKKKVDKKKLAMMEEFLRSLKLKSMKVKCGRGRRTLLSSFLFKYLRRFFFGTRYSALTCSSFPVLFPVSKMYEADFRTLTGIFIGSFDYRCIPYTVHLRPYFFHQFFVRTAF